MAHPQRARILVDIVTAEDPAKAWKELTLDRQRAVVETLATVTLLPGRPEAVAIAVYGALGTGPHGEAVEVTHTWEDVEARLGRLVLTAAAVLDDLTGEAWDTVDDRLRFLVARVAASAGHEPRLTRSSASSLALRTHSPLGRVCPASQWETSGRRVGDDHGVVMQSGARKC